MPDYSDLERLQEPTSSRPRKMGFRLPTAPAIPKPIEYPEMDMSGLQNWLSSMMGRQLMPGKLTPERIGGITNKMLGPLMQMKAEYPFQKYGAEESSRRWGAGMETGIWGTEFGGALEMWAKRLMASLQQQELAQRERFFRQQFLSSGGMIPSGGVVGG